MINTASFYVTRLVTHKRFHGSLDIIVPVTQCSYLLPVVVKVCGVFRMTPGTYAPCIPLLLVSRSDSMVQKRGLSLGTARAAACQLCSSAKLNPVLSQKWIR